MQKNTTNILSLPKLAIKLNTRITDLCPLCGNPTNPNIGVEVVCDETGLVVCRACTLQHAPELAYLMSLSDTARLLAISERDFGVKFEELHFPEHAGINWREFEEKDNVIPFPRKEAV
ncbi:MAG TPA: hypothetical protein VF596_07780 [Pyrinomonadaceae bacterium]|jgi:hypothetical protein